MKLIRTLIRAFVTWSLFMFIVGGAAVGFGAPRNHLAEGVMDAVILAGIAFASVRWYGRRQQRRATQLAAQAAESLPAAPTSLVPTATGQDVTAVTVFIGTGPGQIAAVANSMPASQTPLAPGMPTATATQSPASEPQPVDEIPGERGARLALNSGRRADTGAPSIITVTYRGEPKAYVTLDSWAPIGEFSELSPEDPEYRLVALMSVYAQNVLLGFETKYSEKDAIAHALGELMPHELLEQDLPEPVQTAQALRLPDDVLSPENVRALRGLIAERNAAEALNSQQVDRA